MLLDDRPKEQPANRAWGATSGVDGALGFQAGRPQPLPQTYHERAALMPWVPSAVSIKQCDETSPACVRATVNIKLR